MSAFDDDDAEEEFFECAPGPVGGGVLGPALREEATSDGEGLVASGPTKETCTSPGHDEVDATVQAVDGINLSEQEPSEVACVDTTEKSLELALTCKEEGNTFFRSKDYDNACQSYSQAIDYCPVDDKESLATLFGNRAAAYFMTEDHELVVDDCERALELKPDYVKVLGRRMQSLEKLMKVEDALADAKRIQELDPSFPKIAATVKRLQALNDEKMAKLKDEAMGKLKDLGNTILGNFGMSLDNFKMVQDPNTGSWSISMQK